MSDFAGSHVVVTGGTGALGRAVVGALRAGGAVCHVPNLVAAELADFPFSADPEVHIARGVDTADEAAVGAFYRALPPLWASIHLAGGFAMAPAAETSAADFTAQFRMNALSAFLCSAAAIRAIRARGGLGPGGAAGGRIVNVAARPALEPRLGAGMVAYTASKSAVAALTQALAQEVAEEQISDQRRRALDPQHAGQPDGNARCRAQELGGAGRPRRGHRLSRLAGQPRHPRRRDPGLRRLVSSCTFGR